MNTIHNSLYFLKNRNVFNILLFLFLLFFLSSCQESSNDLINSPGTDNVSVGFFAEKPSNNSLVLTEAKFVLKEMVLKTEHGENECGVKLGPFVVKLELTEKVIVEAITTIPQGNYDAIKFKVHKPGPNDNINDPDFINGNNERFSVVVKGFFGWTPFVYKTSVTVSKKIDFEGQPVTVALRPLINITIRLNPYSWFVENGITLDPSVQSNMHVIDKNIKESLRRAFKDLDKDGDPD